MAQSKRIVVNLPKNMLNEIDEVLKEDNKNRSEFIQQAIILYIEEEKKYLLKERMIAGYMEMSKLNQEIAEFGFDADVCDFHEYEAKLAECDSLDDDNSEKRRYILC